MLLISVHILKRVNYSLSIDPRLKLRTRVKIILLIVFCILLRSDLEISSPDWLIVVTIILNFVELHVRNYSTQISHLPLELLMQVGLLFLGRDNRVLVEIAVRKASKSLLAADSIIEEGPTHCSSSLATRIVQLVHSKHPKLPAIG